MRGILSFLVVSVASCAPASVPDAGTVDAGVVDAGAGDADTTPSDVPIGADAYRRWSEWARIRLNERAIMMSTHDRSGGNADPSHYLRRDAAGLSIPLDLRAPGVLYFTRFNHWHGSPWHFIVDDRDTVVTETSTASPDAPVAGSVFMPSDVFPFPLARTWSDTRGADLSWVPIPFERTMTLGYGRTHYGTGYYIAHLFPEGTPIVGWDAGPPPAELVALAGSDAESLVPAGLTTQTGMVDVPATEPVVLADIAGPARIRALVLEVPTASQEALASAHLRITFDGRAVPSVDAPVGLFFGTGSMHNRDSREWLVRAFPVTVHVLPTTVRFTTVFPMPFATSAHLELVGSGTATPSVRWTIGSERDSGTREEGYFHATYRDHGVGVPRRDLVLLDTTEQEGSTEWCGSVVGTSVIFTDLANLGTLEGDPRFFFDDSEHPQAQGTGSEEWGGGGDYWGGQTMTMPFVGHPVGAGSPPEADSAEDQINSLYRFLLADLFPFGKNARIQLEHGGVDESTEHYRSIVYWYGRPGACLVRTDTLQIGDLASESAHGYASPDSSAPEMITGAWDVGPTSPVTSDVGRQTTGTSELTLAIDPRNVGVLLRRKLDYDFPDQRADAFVADTSLGAAFVHAGVWMSPGSTTCVYSDPPSETGAPQTILQTSDRRFRQEELLLPPRLTTGRSAIRVRIVFSPTHVPVAPGIPVAPEAWSEIRYDAYSYLAP